MATRTYTISKGHQYDRQGAYVKHGVLWANYDRAGQYVSGHIPAAVDSELVAAAIRRVIETGITETLTLGTPAQPLTTKQAAWVDAHDALMADMDRADSRY